MNKPVRKAANAALAKYSKEDSTFHAGLAVGLDAGFTDGFETGWNDCFDASFDDGFDAGWNGGLEHGLDGGCKSCRCKHDKVNELLSLARAGQFTIQPIACNSGGTRTLTFVPVPKGKKRTTKAKQAGAQ